MKCPKCNHVIDEHTFTHCLHVDMNDKIYEPVKGCECKLSASEVAKLITADMITALENIKETAENAQGEWLSVSLAYCPDWVGTYRDIANLAADSLPVLNGGRK